MKKRKPKYGGLGLTVTVNMRLPRRLVTASKKFPGTQSEFYVFLYNHWKGKGSDETGSITTRICGTCGKKVVCKEGLPDTCESVEDV